MHTQTHTHTATMQSDSTHLLRPETDIMHRAGYWRISNGQLGEIMTDITAQSVMLQHFLPAIRLISLRQLQFLSSAPSFYP